jgi:hypothetical protein
MLSLVTASVIAALIGNVRASEITGTYVGTMVAVAG